MEADFSIELGHDDPVLDFPWSDPSGKLAYVDLKRHPELVAGIEEARRYRELATFLRTLNSAHSAFETAKCDVWATTELAPEEDIFGASHKLVSYVDMMVGRSEQNDAAVLERRTSFGFHEAFARRLSELLGRAPNIPASVEICVRRCFYADAQNAGGNAGRAIEGFYFTLYVSGFGDDERSAKKNWVIALDLLANAILQILAGS